MKSRKDGAQMGHNDGTQAPLEPMPKHPHILKREGRYYYRRRIPSELVQAGCYGKAKDIKRSLKTGDLPTANRLAMTVALQMDEEFRTKRRELKQTGQIDLCCKPNKNDKKRRLSELSEIERNDFIMRFFITSEQRASKTRMNPDSEDREEILEIVGSDLSDLERLQHSEESNWLTQIKKALDADGISSDGADIPSLHDLARQMLRAEVETKFRTVQALSGHQHESRDPLFKAFHADSPLPIAAKPSKTVGDLCKDYMEHNLRKVEKRRLAQSTIPKIEMRCRILTDLFGAGKALNSLTSEDGFRLVDFLLTLPHSASKRYKGVSLVTASEIESKLEPKRLIHSETADDYLTGLSAMLTYALECGWMKENPLKGRLIRDRMPRRIKRDRQTLSPDEMTKVFSSPAFQSERHGPKPARYWVPLLCLFLGPRSNEMAGMRVSDVEEDNGIAFLNLREHGEHRLKTEDSARRVPLHQKLIDLGFLEFVAKRRVEDAKGYLFTGLSRNANGSMADAVGKWWHRFVNEILGASPADGPTGARGIHSLRHSWVNAARAAGLDESTRNRLGGWSQKDASEGYGWSGALPMLKTAIDKIEFPGVKFPAYRRIARH